MICNTEFALQMFSAQPEEGLQLWTKFNQIIGDDRCLEHDDGVRLNDSEAASLIKNFASVNNPKDLQTFEKEERKKMLRLLREQGLSIRQIERLTGLSFGVIRRS